MHITIKKNKNGRIVIRLFGNNGDIVKTTEEDLIHVIGTLNKSENKFEFWGEKEDWIKAYNKLLIFKALDKKTNKVK